MILSTKEYPLYTDPYYFYDVYIQQQRIRFKFSWNKYGFWTLCFLDNNNKLLTSFKLVVGSNLIKNYSYDSNLPDIQIFLYDLSSIEYPEQYNITQKFKLLVFDNLQEETRD